MIKSNLHDFWYRCLFVSLIRIHKVLCRSRLVCNNYRRNKKRLIRVKFQVIADKIDGSYSNCSVGKDRHGCGDAVVFRGRY